MTVDTGNLRRWADAVTGWHESGMTLTTMTVATDLATLSRAAADELEQLRAALAAVPHSTLCAFMTTAYDEPCCCPKSLNNDPTEVEVEGSLFPVADLPDILRRHMQALDAAARREKQHWIDHHEQTSPTLAERLARAATVAYRGPDDTDAGMLRRYADNIEHGYQGGGSNLTAAVARVLTTVADTIDLTP
ncbi:hypothetical protein J2X60_002985 [Curtobacterium sp. 320]|uniref:hypothetical protein n=1 Tax=Curtobacterium sp. 320 TaxID=2817749 RepID=UPI002861B933|nr:hypothetical protein [Curtobacterium sp. 320]MDR6574326.1 hypothetical protein [Curtobacterium sp. 320]